MNRPGGGKLNAIDLSVKWCAWVGVLHKLSVVEIDIELGNSQEEMFNACLLTDSTLNAYFIVWQQ